MCLTSSKDADIAFFESVIREVGEHQFLLKTQQPYETGCGRHAAQILCQLLHTCVDFSGPKSVAPVDDLTSSSSLDPPATTISLSTGACEHNSSDKKGARSALLSANYRKIYQFFGRGTSRPSTSRLIGSAALLRRFLVIPLIVSSLYLSITTSIL